MRLSHSTACVGNSSEPPQPSSLVLHATRRVSATTILRQMLRGLNYATSPPPALTVYLCAVRRLGQWQLDVRRANILCRLPIPQPFVEKRGTCLRVNDSGVSPLVIVSHLALYRWRREGRARCEHSRSYEVLYSPSLGTTGSRGAGSCSTDRRPMEDARLQGVGRWWQRPGARAIAVVCTENPRCLRDRRPLADNPSHSNRTRRPPRRLAFLFVTTPNTVRIHPQQKNPERS